MPYEFVGEYLDENDVPVHNARVIANRRFDGAVLGTALTGVDGTFTIDSIAQNDLAYLTAVQDGFLPQVYDAIEPVLYEITLDAPVLSGEETSDTTFDLSWTAVVSPFLDSYKLYRSVNGGAYSLLTTVGANDPRVYTDTVANPNTYDYKVQAIADGTAGVNDSAFSNIVEEIPPAPPVSGINFSFISGSSPPGIPPFGLWTLTGSSYGTELTANPDLAGADKLGAITFNLIHTGPVFQIVSVVGDPILAPYMTGLGIRIEELDTDLLFSDASTFTSDTWQWNSPPFPDFVDGVTYTVSPATGLTKTVVVTPGDPAPEKYPWTAAGGWGTFGWGYGNNHGDASLHVPVTGSIDDDVVFGKQLDFVGVEVEGADPSWIGNVWIGFRSGPPPFDTVTIHLTGGSVFVLNYDDANIDTYSNFGISGTDGKVMVWSVELQTTNAAIKAAMDAYFLRPSMGSATTSVTFDRAEI